jgi:hypothetical protein
MGTEPNVEGKSDWNESTPADGDLGRADPSLYDGDDDSVDESSDARAATQANP